MQLTLQLQIVCSSLELRFVLLRSLSHSLPSCISLPVCDGLAFINDHPVSSEQCKKQIHTPFGSSSQNPFPLSCTAHYRTCLHIYPWPRIPVSKYSKVTLWLPYGSHFKTFHREIRLHAPRQFRLFLPPPSSILQLMVLLLRMYEVVWSKSTRWASIPRGGTKVAI